MRFLFATDVHGSTKVWKKFINSAKFYKLDAIILGGDMTGKAIVPIIKQPDGTFKSIFKESEIILKKNDVKDFEERVENIGYYSYLMDPKEMEEYEANYEKQDKLFLQLMIDRLKKWLMFAEERLKGTNVNCYVCPGNDDRLEIDPIIKDSEYVTCAEGKKINIGKCEMISCGWTNPTPWNTPRECTEEQLKERILGYLHKIDNVEDAIFAFHAPPYDSGLDAAPKLDKDLRPQVGETFPVGSTAVREIIEEYQPLLGLHGHIHEARAERRIGRTLCVNPGSEYEAGILNGVIINLDGNKIKSHFFVSG
ncbi:MAG: metallophosphoesterase family protein [Candidatus Freyarchaeota archaeon]